MAYANRELRTALSFLISPFFDNPDESKIDINLYYRNQQIDVRFSSEMVNLAESCHTFELNNRSYSRGLLKECTELL